MSDNINIFDEAKQGEFFSFKKIGDSIQGTYISIQENSTDSFGNQQNIYVIQDADGKVWNISFRLSNTIVNERMAGIKFGQIVGFRFDEERDSKKMPGSKAKIIRIYADPKFVNKEWLAAQLVLDSNYTGAKAPARIESKDEQPNHSDGVAFGTPEGFSVPEDASPASGVLPTASDASKPRNDAIDAIMKLALTKGLINETMTEEEGEAAIEKYTGLELNEENLTKVIISLTGYSK